MINPVGGVGSVEPNTEPDYERLVKVVQNREGNHPKEEREKALITLAQQFRYLIKKISTQCWRKATGETKEDFEHDTMTCFCEMVLVDYIPKAYGGLAHFGPYIQTKLYYRTLWRAQKAVRDSGRSFVSDFSGEYDGNYQIKGTELIRKGLSPEVRDAIVATSTNVEDDVIGQMRDDEIETLLHEIMSIAARVLDKREKFVWDAYLYSPMLVKEIGNKMEPPIGTSRVNQIVIIARKKVLEEFGRQRIKRGLLC